MSEPRCRWAGLDNPRVLADRHAETCDGEDCAGCLPCPMDHCRVCGVAHATGACPGCIAETRETLHDIARMCAALPDEVEHRGVEGEAMVLLGPACDPEARGHLEASVAAGRVSPEWLAEAVGDTHPLWVAGSYEMVYRAEWDQESADLVTLADALAYLDRNLARAAEWPHVPFEDFAHDLRRCRAHLEAVLHDGEQIDQGVPCVKCGRRLERVWAMRPEDDGWRCRNCRTTSNEAQYRMAVKADYIDRAEWLTDVDMQVRTGVKAGTVRVWAQRGHVTRKQDQGRVVYSVADVETRRDTSDLAS